MQGRTIRPFKNVEIAKAAIAAGAEVIEKHIALNNKKMDSLTFLIREKK